MYNAVERTPERVAELMKKTSEIKDIEVRHAMADALLCETLKALGYDEAVDIFDKMHVWYS